MQLADLGARVIEWDLLMVMTQDNLDLFKNISIYLRLLIEKKSQLTTQAKRSKYTTSIDKKADVLVENFRPRTMEKLT